MNYFTGPLSKYADFSGRARRKEYWMFYLTYIVAMVVASVVDSIIGFPALTIVLVLGMIIPCLSLTVRRLHDTGRSGWMFFISMVPVVGGLILFFFMVQDSRDDNDYGPNPKAVEVAV